MAALTCDLCGGKLTMGVGGIATCDSCGMQHSPDRMKEKIQEIKGTVRIDKSHLIDNYLEMANAAYDSDNNVEAEVYCNKIIEIEPTNYKAWWLKGKAVVWQSTLPNLRLSESVLAFTKAILNSPIEEKEEIIEDIKYEIINLSNAMIALRGKCFSRLPDKEEKNGFSSDIISILNILKQFMEQAHVVIPLQELLSSMATTINQSVVKAFNDVIWPDYNGDPNDSDDRADKYEWQRYIERIGYCTDLVKQAIDLCDEDDESDIQRYENLIYLHEKAIDSCSWDFTFSAYSDSKIWSKEWMLTDEAKNSRRKLIQIYKSKIYLIKENTERKKQKEKEARIKAYWDTHEFEKNVLENEKKNLEDIKERTTAQIAELQKSKEKVPSVELFDKNQKEIAALEMRKKALGMFKFKEKKTLQELIDVLVIKKFEINKQIVKEQQEIEKQITPIRAELNEAIARIKEIDNELTIDRVIEDDE